MVGRDSGGKKKGGGITTQNGRTPPRAEGGAGVDSNPRVSPTLDTGRHHRPFRGETSRNTELHERIFLNRRHSRSQEKKAGEGGKEVARGRKRKGFLCWIHLGGVIREQ